MYSKLVYYTYMPHVSRFKLDKKTESNLVNTFELVLAKLSKEEQIREFLFSMLSSTERLMLAKRLAIVVLLKEGVPQTKVAQTLHVTRVTVGKMQLLLEARSKGFEAALEKLNQEQNMREIKTMLLNLAGYSIRAAGGRAPIPFNH